MKHCLKEEPARKFGVLKVRYEIRPKWIQMLIVFSFFLTLAPVFSNPPLPLSGHSSSLHHSTFFCSPERSTWAAITFGLDEAKPNTRQKEVKTRNSLLCSKPSSATVKAFSVKMSNLVYERKVATRENKSTLGPNLLWKNSIFVSK